MVGKGRVLIQESKTPVHGRGSAATQQGEPTSYREGIYEDQRRNEYRKLDGDTPYSLAPDVVYAIAPADEMKCCPTSTSRIPIPWSAVGSQLVRLFQSLQCHMFPVLPLLALHGQLGPMCIVATHVAALPFTWPLLLTYNHVFEIQQGNWSRRSTRCPVSHHQSTIRRQTVVAKAAPITAYGMVWYVTPRN
jgi:hypothetical protein